jgi:hypothetical protein
VFHTVSVQVEHPQYVLAVGFDVVGLNVGLLVMGLLVTGFAVVGMLVVGFFVVHDIVSQRHTDGNSEATLWHADASL